jgi:hypothetical protein
MKPLSRRSVTAGLAAAVTAFPAAGPLKGAPEPSPGDQRYMLPLCPSCFEIETKARERDQAEWERLNRSTDRH